MLEKDEVIEGEITAIAFGGEGILRHKGFVVFVPFTAKGEVVQAEITEVHSSFARGRLQEIVKPSPWRIAAKCPNFGACGGCQFQHLQMAEQLSIKQQLLKDALQRIGQLDELPIQPIRGADLQWHYRRYITLHLEPQRHGFRAGYVTTDNKSILPIYECPIFEPRKAPILPFLQQFIANLEVMQQKEGRVVLHKWHENEWICHFELAELPRNFVSLVEKTLAQKSPFKGVILTTPQKTHTFGTVEIPLFVNGFDFLASPLAFMQNHPEQSSAIYHVVCETVENFKIKKVLDLYCGIGLASILLAQRGITSIGVEYNQEAICLAKRNAAIHNAKHVQFFQGDVQKLLKNLLKAESPDLVLLNPPRGGLNPKIIDTLLKSPPHHLLYISCMPATLARDLKLLLASKYQIHSIQPFDMFPQTTHLETIVHLIAPTAL